LNDPVYFYNSTFFSCWSWYGAPAWLCSLIDVSRGVFAGFEPRRPGSLSKSRQYFLCEIVIPSLECATSKLRKYYTYFAAVYFNKETPNLFRIHIHVTLSELKQQLDELNGLLTGHRDNRRVATVEYRRPSYQTVASLVSQYGSSHGRRC
jgi:hypothetical protein